MGIRFEERFIELFSARQPGDTQNTSYGSGFLLGNGIILTARHVVAPAKWEPFPPELDITARQVREAQPSETWWSADLIWPEHGNLGSDGPDIALLRLRNIPLELKNDTLPSIGLDLEKDDSSERDYVIDVYAVGFPKFAEINFLKGRVRRRDSHQIVCVTKPYSGLTSQTFEIDIRNFGKTKTNEVPTDKFDWHGFSGAALIASRSVIGVVVTELKNGRFDFRAIRINKALLNQEDFSSAIKGAATVVGETSSIELPPIDRLVCLLDRVPQEADFVDAHKRCCPSPQVDGPGSPVRPMICLLPGAGEYRHSGEEMADRFSLKTLPELAWPVGSTGFQWLDWPPSHLDLDAAFARLRASLWNAICGRSSVPDDPREFQTLWKDGSRPRLFLSDLTPILLNSKTAQVLGAWSKFLAQLTPPDRWPPTHLLLLAATWPEAKAWCEQAAPNVAHTAIEPLTELNQCSPIDLGRWFKDCLPNHVAPAHMRILAQWETQLTGEFPSLFYLQHLKSSVKKLVYGGGYG